MFPRLWKIALVYAVFGAVFGLMWGFGVYLPAGGFVGFDFFGGGVLFLSALALCTWYLAHRGLVVLDASRTRLVVSALIVIAAYPLSLFSLFVPYWFESLLQRTHHWFFYAKHLESIQKDYPLCFSAVIASLTIWVALGVALKEWNKKPLAQLLVSGIFVAALFSTIETNRMGAQFELAVETQFSILFAVGQSLFAAICGHAIASHSRSVQALRANRVD